MKLYSILDEKAGTFCPPFVCVSNGVAVRQLMDLVQDEKTTISKYPEDFSLYFVGDFADDTGLLLPLDSVPVLVMHAKDAIIIDSK